MSKETNNKLTSLLSNFAKRAKSDVGEKIGGVPNFFSALASGEFVVGKGGIFLYPGRIVSMDGHNNKENVEIIGLDTFNPNGNATLISVHDEEKSYSVPIASLRPKRDRIAGDKQATDEYHCE